MYNSKIVMQSTQQMLDELTFSFSRLSLFESCPYRWFLRYAVKREEAAAEPLMFGKAEHKAIEMKMRGMTDKEALLEGLEEIDFYPINLEEYQRLFFNAPVARGEALMDSCDVEQHFIFPLDEEGQFKLQGIIDVVRVIFGSIEFIDWKTNRVMYNPDETMQLALYAWALSKMHNVDSVRGTLFFLRFYKQNRRRQIYEKTDIEAAHAWALSLAKAIRSALEKYQQDESVFSTVFPPKANPGCANCSFAEECVKNYPKNRKGVFVEC